MVRRAKKRSNLAIVFRDQRSSLYPRIGPGFAYQIKCLGRLTSCEDNEITSTQRNRQVNRHLQLQLGKQTSIPRPAASLIRIAHWYWQFVQWDFGSHCTMISAFIMPPIPFVIFINFLNISKNRLKKFILGNFLQSFLLEYYKVKTLIKLLTSLKGASCLYSKVSTSSGAGIFQCCFIDIKSYL